MQGLLGMGRVLNVWIRELCGDMKGWMKVFSDGFAILKNGGMIGLLKGVCGNVCERLLVCRPWKR